MTSKALIFRGIQNNSHVQGNEVGFLRSYCRDNKAATQRNASTSGSTLRS